MSNDDGPAYRITVTKRERATVLAALEFWNAEVHFSNFKKDGLSIASQGGEFQRLTQSEVRQFSARLKAAEPRTVGVASP